MTKKAKMKRFSERMGITKPLKIQLDCMNDELRNSLWNDIFLGLNNFSDSNLKKLCNSLALHFFKIPLDEIQDLGVTEDIAGEEYLFGSK